MVCILSTPLKAQSPDQLLQIGDKLFESGEYYGSIGFYQKALNLDSNNAEVLYKYGRNLFKINRFDRASRYLLKASLLGGKENYPLLSYELAESYRHLGDYRKARRHYTTALRPYRMDRDSYWYKRINQSKESAEWASDHEASEESIQIINWGKEINSPYAEYGATVVEDKLFFASLRADSNLSNYVIQDKDFYSHLYYTPKKQKAVSPLKIDAKLKKASQDKHILNLNIQHNWAYFSLCDTNYQCEIWRGKIDDNQIGSASKLNSNINLSGTNNTQAYPVEIEGQQYLFFASDRKGGFGEMDIWVAKEADFGFEKPKNLGAVINTLGDEITPYYNSNTHMLYFSSNWHYGYGGFDIFKSKGKFTNYQKVENLGKSINSIGNDYYFQQFGDSALLSSNRLNENTGGALSCCNDLFKLAYEQAIHAEDTLTEKDQEVEQILSSVDIEVDVEVLNQYLPADLYFHNDIPKPSSNDTLTDANYEKLAYDYLSMTEMYLSTMEKVGATEEELDNLSAFFEEDVKNGIQSLAYFSPLLLKELEKGSKIELSILGFASALSKEDYNYKLTLRRIQSLINYFKSYKNGAFLPYIQKTASNGGSLEFIKLPFGEFAFNNQLDQLSKTEAVYSLEAAKQRKIELIAITKQATEESPRSSLEFNTQHYQLGEIKKAPLQRFFQLSNHGTSPIKIYNVNANCDCVNLEYPTKIAPKSEERLIVNIDTQELSGQIKIELTVVTDNQPNLHTLIIEFSL